MASKECLDCGGHLEQLTYDSSGQYIVDDQECLTCKGSGLAPREKNPYWLHHAEEWSDGVDRTHRLRSEEFGEANPERVRVLPGLLYSHQTFNVYKGPAIYDTLWGLGNAMTVAQCVATRGNTNGK